MKRFVCWLVCGLCLLIAEFSRAADSVSIPLDCQRIASCGSWTATYRSAGGRFFGDPPSGRKLVCESNGLRPHFLETPGAGGSSFRAAVVQ